MQTKLVIYDETKNLINSYYRQSKVVCGNGIIILDEYFTKIKPKKIALICTDSDYFLIGKKIKDSLNAKYNVVCFCIDGQNGIFNNINHLFYDENDFDVVICIGCEKLILSCKYVSSENGCKFIAIPTFLYVNDLLSTKINYLIYGKNTNLTCKCDLLIYDEMVVASFNKQKLRSAFLSVTAKKIYFIENDIFTLLNGKNNQSAYLQLLNKSLNLCYQYANNLDINYLLNSIIIASVVKDKIAFQDSTYCYAEILSTFPINALFGEKQFYGFKKLLKLYKIFILNDLSYLVKTSNVYYPAEKIKKYYKCDYSAVEKLIELCNYTNSQLDSYSQIINKNCGELDLKITNLLQECLNIDKLAKGIYAGKKFTVEHFSLKENQEVLKIAPLLLPKDSLFKFMWNRGVFEYL